MLVIEVFPINQDRSGQQKTKRAKTAVYHVPQGQRETPGNNLNAQEGTKNPCFAL